MYEQVRILYLCCFPLSTRSMNIYALLWCYICLWWLLRMIGSFHRRENWWYWALMEELICWSFLWRKNWRLGTCEEVTKLLWDLCCKFWRIESKSDFGGIWEVLTPSNTWLQLQEVRFDLPKAYLNSYSHKDGKNECCYIDAKYPFVEGSSVIQYCIWIHHILLNLKVILDLKV